MKAAFPYMGDIHIILESILRHIGVETIIPPNPNKDTLAMGAQLAPETICLPFKVTLGNMVKALEQGADTLIYVTGFWSCRFGYYGRLQADILRELGYRFDLIELRRDRIGEIISRIIDLNRKNIPGTLVKTIRAFRLGLAKAQVIEKLNYSARITLPFVKDPADCRKLFQSFTEKIKSSMHPGELKSIRRSITDSFSTIPRKSSNEVIKIKLVGESYCTIEPFVNFDIIWHLGELGVLVDPFLTGPRWLGFHGFRLGKSEVARIQKKAHKYWRYCVGGEDANALGHLIIAAEAGYDGVIHIHPFACMPSTVVQPALIKASKDYNIPLLFISLDEHTIETGFLTRIDAFVSILERKRRSLKNPLEKESQDNFSKRVIPQSEDILTMNRRNL